MRTINFPALALLSVLFISINSYSQKDQTDSSKNSLVKNSISLQFGIARNFDVGGFSNFSFCGKFHLSGISALRLGISADYASSDGSSNSQNYNDYSAYDILNCRSGYGVDLLYILYLNPSSDVNIFLGGGPSASISSTVDERDPKQTNINSYDYEYFSRTDWGIGPKFIAGGEWFFMKRMSLFLEYEASFYFGKSKSKSTHITATNYDKREDDMNITRFRANTARLGLSLYFTPFH